MEVDQERQDVSDQEADQGRQRGFGPVPERGLYSFAHEHDACGVGLVADLKNEPTHRVVEMGLTVLKRLTHRGAVGSDPETGDGAGLLLALPDEFLRRELNNKLPEPGCYGVAMVFGGVGAEAEIERIVGAENARVISWRAVPVQPEVIGSAARRNCPVIRQLFIGGEAFADQAAFERQLFVIRRLIEKAVPGCYLCSCSSRSIVYKGLLLAGQVERFYLDLASEQFKSPLALVHQRYSTNTFPTWELAHPFRYLAHNGEINTLRGNLNNLRAREPHLASALLGDDLAKVLPLIRPGQSDSACLDNMFELLTACGRDLRHAMLMLMPQAWGEKYYMGRDVRTFFEYHSALMEPWDGPAAVAFSDGVNAGAILDRNGLRPARYTLTADNIFVLASEAGVLDIPASEVIRRGRLRPGEMIYCDMENHRLVYDGEIKNLVARRQPYRRWVEQNKIAVRGLFSVITASDRSQTLFDEQRLFGYSREDLELIIAPMAAKGHEPLGSMGNDAALAVLSDKPQLLFSYFKQLFAQVTNPPIDPIREELVMSLTTYIGNHANILAETPAHAQLIKLSRPLLTDGEINTLQQIKLENFRSRVLPLAFGLTDADCSLKKALEQLAKSAVRAVKGGCRILILSDRQLGDNLVPIPSLLATVTVNKALVDAGLRSEVGLIIQSGEVREIMHFALLLGFGATAVNPYLALASVSALVENGTVDADKVTATDNYIKAVDKGLLKVISKMGISTLRSYRSAQIFEAVGLSRELVDKYFPGAVSRIGGIGLDEIAAEARERCRAAQEKTQLLPFGGQYRYRRSGERHLWTPESLAAFRQAVQSGDPLKYQEYVRLIDDQAERLCTLRGLFEFAPTAPIPLEEVESVEAIIRHFVSGAMSLGSLSPEAHETIAVAMNRLGAMSNSGEGGEDPERYCPGPHGEDRASAIKQVASGRFGVTVNYLRHARELQIKMAQGAKPGEGGQLPGHKVNEFIARIRHSMPYVSLISPPPHHDIYSIEDLAQLIYDLRSANPKARISVKLVSEVGVGTVAAGVAKAHSDVILISGHDGGTGASPLTSIKHAGLPWELGLAETQQTLVLNKLRSKVRLQVDGQLKTGRDVIVGALLGAEEFGFATTILICIGCLMMRKCHDNSCPFGVATQDPELRKNFRGKPEYIENFLRFLAREVREYLARLGLRSLDEAVGRSELLRVNKAIDFYKARHLDFSKILEPVQMPEVRYNPESGEELHNYDRDYLLGPFRESIVSGSKAELELPICNVNRAVGTELSGEIVAHHGEKGLPRDTVKVRFTGCAGQSFGAFLAPGVTFELSGEANDYVGKGLSGGRIIIKPEADAGFAADQNVIAGNVIGYGATGGEIFISGQAGERFAVRNSGITAVVEGVGDHGCEYMTGGRVVVLGRTGVNFAAGMTGGIAYVYDQSNDFDLRCNVETVDLESVLPDSESETELLSLLRGHLTLTGSRRAAAILNNWVNERDKFVKVFPVDYRQALERLKQRDAAAANQDDYLINEE
ncbi:MAG: glutamate synthase large subunit [Victivallaceae bacterium]|nr:glutamate synthase large subunit [Victivallaceae bacterium]